VLKLDPKNKVAREQLETTVKLIRRIEFEKAINVGETETTSHKVLNMIKDGAVSLDVGSWKGPLPKFNEERNRYEPTKEVVEGMIAAFKEGGKLPKRIAFEIILGCMEALEKEASLVEVTIEKGVKCDIVGDTHGVSFRHTDRFSYAF
jgi:serine/threonine-protein phosphatase 5